MIVFALVMVLATAPKENPFKARVESLRTLKREKSKDFEATSQKLLKELTAAAKSKDKDVETLVLVGRTQYYLEDDAAAALTLDEAIKLNPSDADAQFYRGIVARQMNALEPAIGFFKKSVELAPDNARSWSELGATLAAVDKYDEAIAALNKAMTLDPKDAWSFSLAGRLMMEQGKEKEGVVLLEKAIELEPRDTQAAYNAGLHYQLTGNPKRALELFEKVAKADPNDWHTLTKLVQLHQALGNVAERDRRRAEVMKLFREGKTDPKRPEFCREQFELKGQRVMVFESFELKGERAVRYSFRVVTLPGEKVARVISLGSYDFTTNYMREKGDLKPDERAWHLDGYFPDNTHETYGIFTKEPTYEQTREMVLEVLSGKLKAASSTTMKKQ